MIERHWTPTRYGWTRDRSEKTTTRASDTQTHKLTRHYWLADWHTHRHTERKKENIPSEKQRKPLAHHATPLDAALQFILNLFGAFWVLLFSKLSIRVPCAHRERVLHRDGSA